MLCSNFYTTHEDFAYRLDLRQWQPGEAITPELLCRFPSRARALNGSCLIAPHVILVADSFAGLIWRLDVPTDGGQPGIRVWLEDESKGCFAGKMKPEQLGVKGFSIPGINSGLTQSVAGDPFTEQFIGPSSAAWKRGSEDYGRVLFVTTDGGTASAPTSERRTAKLLKLELQPLGEHFPGTTT